MTNHKFPDKFNLTGVEERQLFKTVMANLVYSQAKLESIPITLPDTQFLIEQKKSIDNLSLVDMQKVLNIERASRYLLEAIEEPLDLDFISKINQMIVYAEIPDAGERRTYHVTVGSDFWMPDVPDEAETRTALRGILESSDSKTQQAIDLFLFLCKTQYFGNGNKRTAMLADGTGVFIIPERQLRLFVWHLLAYYEYAEYQKIAEFLYENAIGGLIRENSPE